MKCLILSLMLLIVLNVHAVTLYTPNGKSFQTVDGNWPSYNSADFEAWKNNNFGPGKLYPNSYVIGSWENNIWEYNCHSFAWNNWQGAARWDSEGDMWKLGHPSPTALYWLDPPNVFFTDSDNPIGIISYVTTTNQNEAAICTYSGNHSARIVGDGSRHISKWGTGGIVNHPPTEEPYSSINSYYKINPAYRPIGNGDPAGRNWQNISNAINGIQAGGLITVLSGTQNLTENITIPSDVTLIINSGATVNLNGHYIRCSGTGKIENHGDITGYLTYAQEGIYYKGYFPSATTLQQILSWASSGWNIVLRSGTYDNSDHLTVNSGITLSINPGVTLKFASSKKLTINGTIVATGTSSQRITFQANSGTWYGIEVNYGGYTAFNYCNIKNATCGIRGYQTSNLTLDHCEITNNTNGVTFINQSSGYVRYSKINSNMGNSGINCAQNSNPIIRPNNQLKYNTPAGLYGDYNSLPELGSWAYNGNNSISNSYDDVWSENSNRVYALYNYWGSSSPNPGVSDNIEWEPYLTTDPNGGSLHKLLAENPGTADRDTTGQTEFARAYQTYF